MQTIKILTILFCSFSSLCWNLFCQEQAIDWKSWDDNYGISINDLTQIRSVALAEFAKKSGASYSRMRYVGREEEIVALKELLPKIDERFATDAESLKRTEDGVIDAKTGGPAVEIAIMILKIEYKEEEAEATIWLHWYSGELAGGTVSITMKSRAENIAWSVVKYQDRDEA